MSEWDTLSDNFYSRMLELKDRMDRGDFEPTPKHDDPVVSKNTKQLNICIHLSIQF